LRQIPKGKVEKSQKEMQQEVEENQGLRLVS